MCEIESSNIMKSVYQEANLLKTKTTDTSIINIPKPDKPEPKRLKSA